MVDAGFSSLRAFGSDWAHRSAEAVARTVVLGVDRRLRQSARIAEFTGDASCVLRFSVEEAQRDVLLSDGLVPEGATFLDLHLWNEHMPPMPTAGPSMAWSASVLRRVLHSFAALAMLIEHDPSFDDVRAVRARLAWARLGREVVYRRLGERMGFEEVDDLPPEIGRRLHDAFENVWLAALDWTFHPAVQPRLRLLRAREQLWMSRARLVERFAHAREPGGPRAAPDEPRSWDPPAPA